MAFDANDLSPHEQFVVERTREGEVADFTPMIGAGGAKSQVRAGFLRKLMLGLEPGWPVRAPGVRLKSVRIEGVLDLTDCSGAGGAGLPALSLENCDIPDAIDLSHARLARVSLRGSRLRRLVAVETSIDGELDLCEATPLPGDDGGEVFTARLRGLSVDGDFIARGAKFARAVDSADLDAIFMQGADISGNALLDDGFEAFGCVWLSGATIGGRLQCDGGQFLNRSDDGAGVAIAANDTRIGGAACLRGKFKAEGEVGFFGAVIGGDFDIESGSFRNDGASALTLVNVEIRGQMLGGAKIAGQMMLQGARIARNLDLRGAEIANLRRKNGGTPKNEYDVAIDGANLRVGGAALLQGANIKGEIFLADARIDGYLAFGGGRFLNSGGWAIRAPNVRVGGNLTLKIDDSGYAPHGHKTVIEGGAKFDRAKIDGALSWLNLELRGAGPDGAKGPLFSFADASIGGALEARNLIASQDARIDAAGATCAALSDELKSGWGVESTTLDLEGFAYGRLDGGKDRVRDRLVWLRRSRRDDRRFSPQPFTALAQVYSRDGRREDARRVLLAQHDQRTFLASAGPLTWALSSAFGLVAGYGFAPIRAARALILFLALGIAGVLVMDAQGALITPDGRACNGAVEPALYAIDVALPVIDLGQERLCSPGRASDRASSAALFTGIEVPNTEWRLFEAAALWKWAHALYAVLGAILAALAVLTFSGVMKPRQD